MHHQIPIASAHVTIDQVVQEFTTLQPDRPDRFDAMAGAVRAFQLEHNAVYRRFVEAEGGTYLPIEAFKHVPVVSFPVEEARHVFESSGTGRGQPSRHFVRDLEVYGRSFSRHFEAVVGAGPFTFLAHLPQYAQRGQWSSLLFMVDRLIWRRGDDASGFFLDDTDFLEAGIRHSRESGHRLILFGAAFGLLALIERQSFALPDDALVIETGGMKTFRREIGRDALHAHLAKGFGLPREQVWSEYGMCELFSQCYTRGGRVFFPPPWMRFEVVDPELPERVQPEGTPGALAVTDLANLYSCSFLLTQDRAVRRGDGFEILGRLADAELRGCNFLLESA